MPHLVLSTSADVMENVDVPDILEALVAELAGHETVDSRQIKGYHRLHAHWAMGEGAPGGFVHLEVRVLTGRSEDLRVRIADSLLAVLRQRYSASLEAGEVALSLEVREMDPATYRR